MNKSIVRFSIISVALAIVLSVIFRISATTVFAGIPIVPGFLAIAAVFVVTLVFHAFLIKLTWNHPRVFISRFIASSGIKLMIYLIFIVAFAFLRRHEARVFLIVFLVAYFVFTTFEIYSILKILKKNHPAGEL